MKLHKWGFDNFAWFTVLFNRKKIIQQGLFSNELYNSDYELLFKMSLSGKCGILNSISGVYTINSFQINNKLDEKFMFNGYKLYFSLKENSKNYTDKIFCENVKSYLSGCFRYFLDRDVFDDMKFNYLFWFKYFQKEFNGKFFPFFDEDLEERFKLFKENKVLFKKFREEKIKKSWEKVSNPNIIKYLEVYNDK